MASKRPHIPKTIETQVLVRSRRRCCLCVFIDGDMDAKQIQIAHVDHNPKNNNADNLVALCLKHHDEYDTKRSQSKGITIEEVKLYRSRLDEIVQKRDEQIELPLNNLPDSFSSKASYTLASAKLLGLTFEAFDKEVTLLQTNIIPRGISLFEIARMAIQIEGDFDVGLEVFQSLLRLAHLVRDRGFSRSIVTRQDGELTDQMGVWPQGELPEATPTTSAIKTLLLFAQTDHSLFRSANRKAQLYAVAGDFPFAKYSEYHNLPSSGFGAIHTILQATCVQLAQRNLAWASREIIHLSMRSLLGLGVVLKFRGFEMPKPPSLIYRDPSGHRTLSPEEPKELLPFISLASSVAELPEPLFKYAVENVRFFTGLFPAPKPHQDGLELQEAKEGLKRWAVIPGFSLVSFSLKNSEDIGSFNQELHHINELGNQVSLTLAKFMIAERSLLADLV